MTFIAWLLGTLAVLSALTLLTASMLTHHPDFYREDEPDRDSEYEDFGL